MRIAHLCLSNYYSEGHLYQENELVRQHRDDGHHVLVIASTEIIAASGQPTYTAPGISEDDGIRLVRLAYRGLPHIIARKLRIHRGVYDSLSEFRPDVIMFHGCAGWEVRTAARYVRDFPEAKLYLDSHTDWQHSATTVLSREILHKIYYRRVLRSALPQVEKILCVSTEVMDFARQIYAVPDSLLEFYPLGGRPIPDDEYHERRNRVRAGLGLEEGHVLMVQAGKQTLRKRLVASLKALRRVDNPDLRLVVAGVLHEDIRGEVEELIAADSRATSVGWKSSEELTDLLCAADIYLQPGTQSVTMQHSLCCRCAVILNDVPAHKVYPDDNGWRIDSDESLVAAFSAIRDADLVAMSARSYAFACRHLDYKVLSRRILE